MMMTAQLSMFMEWKATENQIQDYSLRLRLLQFVRMYLSIPATSAIVERLFANLRFVETGRENMNVQTLAKITAIRSEFNALVFENKSDRACAAKEILTAAHNYRSKHEKVIEEKDEKDEEQAELV